MCGWWVVATLDEKFDEDISAAIAQEADEEALITFCMGSSTVVHMGGKNSSLG